MTLSIQSLPASTGLSIYHHPDGGVHIKLGKEWGDFAKESAQQLGEYLRGDEDGASYERGVLNGIIHLSALVRDDVSDHLAWEHLVRAYFRATGHAPHAEHFYRLGGDAETDPTTALEDEDA